MQRPMKNMMLFPYQFNCLCWKIAMLLCWILQCWMWQVPTLTTERVTAMVLQAVSFDQWKRCDPLGILFYNVERKLCIAVVTAIVMTLRSLIKTEPRTAKLRQVDSQYEYQGLTGKWTSEWMNQSLVFCSLPLWHFLILSFQVVCFWEKKSFSTTLHVVFPCYLSSFKVLGWFLPVTPFSGNRHLKKTQTEFQCFVHLLEIFLNICANQRKEKSLATPFFCKAYMPFGAPFGAQQWKFPSYLSIFVAFLYYIDAPPSGAWKCSQARPAALQYYGSPLSAVSGTCKEIMWDKCRQMPWKCAPCPVYRKPD